MISKPIKIRVNNKIWWYQRFAPDSLNPNEEIAYRLYDSSGDFVAEFGSYDDMESWILDHAK